MSVPKPTVGRGDVVALDFDNTLTVAHEGDNPYKRGGEQPSEEMVEYANYLKEEINATIIIWTARPWSHAGHIAGLLTMWGCPYNAIRCEKGGADVYVDDKACHVSEVRNYTEPPNGPE